MNQPDFLQSLEQSLHLRAVPFSRAALQAFIESAWRLCEDNPDVEWWAREFVSQADVSMLA